MSPLEIGSIGILVMMGLVVLGVPVAFSLALTGFFGLIIAVGTGAAYAQMATVPFTFTAVFSFAVIPLFLLMGHLAAQADIGTDIYRSLRSWLGRLPGGLAIATNLGSAAFGACSGSSLAAAALFTKVSLPEMIRYGYDQKLAAGCIAAAGTMAQMIPPSVTMVIYGIMSGESIGQLLLAGLIPGLLSATLYSITIYVHCRLNPKIGPLSGESLSISKKIATLRGWWMFLILALLVLGGIYFGLFTPSEAGAIGAFGAFVLVVMRRKFNVKATRNALFESGITTSMVFAIVIGGVIFSRFLIYVGFISGFADLISSLPVPPIVVILMFMAMYLILGSFLDAASMIIVTVPIVMPIVTELGYSPIWFGILTVKMVEIGLITPPLGLNIYVVKGTAGDSIPLGNIFRGIVPFLLTDIFTLGILIAFPKLSLFLPEMMIK